MANEPVKRVCFLLQVKPDRLEEYKRRHADVWPEMREALHKAGWYNYSLFLREDGLLVGYVETPDLSRAIEQMAMTDVNHRWQNEMADFFESAPGLRADEQIASLTEVFHLA
ncbi:MAG: L-rhamnose mutarotase [Candidatus Acidiferrales bacterium]